MDDLIKLVDKVLADYDRQWISDSVIRSLQNDCGVNRQEWES